MEFDPSTFGKLYAAEYDDRHNPGTTDDCVALIADLAEGETLLELAIGSGRVALPLHNRGFEVHGIDGSAEMLALLRNKRGGGDILAELGDMADFTRPRTYGFAYLVFNTIFNLTSQAAQIGCFQSVANCLTPGGRFMVETFVPDVSDFKEGFRLRTLDVDFDTARLEAARYNPVTQLAKFQRLRFTSDGVTLAPLPMRLTWPPELDLMARLAGLTLVERWGGWQRQPFGPSSTMHISVYQKPV